MIAAVALLVILLLAFVFAKGAKNKSRGLMLIGGIPLLLAVLATTAAIAYTKLDVFEIHRLENTFNSDSSQERQQAIQHLSTEAPEEGCLPVILRAIQDEERGVRNAAHNYLRRRYGDLVPIPEGISLSNGYNWSSEHKTGSKDPFDVWVQSWETWIQGRIRNKANKIFEDTGTNAPDPQD